MLSDDELDTMLRGSDPDPGGAATDPDSPDATRILARVSRRARKRRRRVMVLVPAVALSVAAVTAGTYAWVGGDGKGHALDSVSVACRASEQAESVLNFDPRTDDPVRNCRLRWPKMFHAPAPSTLTACVDSSSQGSIIVFVGGRDVCERHRAAPYLGPTQEQVHFADFRDDMRTHLADRTCVPYPEFYRLAAQLLVKHGLDGWKTRHFQSAAKEPEGACAQVIYYDEPERTVYVGDHTAGEPMSDYWP